MKQKMIAPFSNSDEYMDWYNNNCKKCTLSTLNNGQGEDEMPTCPIESSFITGDTTDEQRTTMAQSDGRCGDRNVLGLPQSGVQLGNDEKHARDVVALRNYWTGS